MPLLAHGYLRMSLKAKGKIMERMAIDWEATPGGSEGELDQYNRWKWRSKFTGSNFRHPYELASFGGFGRSCGCELQTKTFPSEKKISDLLTYMERAPRWDWCCLDCECKWTKLSNYALQALRTRYPEVKIITFGIGRPEVRPADAFNYADIIVDWWNIWWPGRMGEDLAFSVASQFWHNRPLLAIPQAVTSVIPFQGPEILTNSWEYQRAMDVCRYAAAGVVMRTAYKVFKDRTEPEAVRISNHWKESVGGDPAILDRYMISHKSKNLKELCRIVWHSGRLPAIAETGLKWGDLSLSTNYTKALLDFASGLPDSRNRVRGIEEELSGQIVS